ncbi:DUF4192 domain-containing protein [Streptomyces zagrosensis]|uniref:DUF4192 domain-containing protein n=1 Tax=Streptomyces zagrosensis TaxID=1042984 RepID=A0A7W9QD42_9ACTN|nr:DUF4192 domain-containing protein [Streptomyces zagrosensis]MBB5937558.1 hypothetical protein [Streptomyces zagrosensis]
MTNRNEPFSPSGSSDSPHPQSSHSADLGQITLRSPAELADALPYLLGFYPTDSVVMIALHGERGRFGGRLRLGIPTTPQDWPAICDQLAECLIAGSRQRGHQITGVVLFLCQDPARDESGQQVMERLRPLAQRLRLACGALEAPIYEALCISEDTFWSYCCPDQRCCPPQGTPLVLPGTSAMAAAAAYAGIQVRGSLRQMEDRLAPLSAPRAPEQEQALDEAATALVPKMLGDADRATVRGKTLNVAGQVLERFKKAEPVTGCSAADDRDDHLLQHDEAAEIILGIQDRATRDRAAEWMEGPEAAPALRLWRALARRCVGAYADHAAAPLTLAGWVAWSLGDEPEARVALSRALHADPDYVFARLLHQACNEGIDPEPLRRCLREAQAGRSADSAVLSAVREELRRLAGKDNKTRRPTGDTPTTGERTVQRKPVPQPPRARDARAVRESGTRSGGDGAPPAHHAAGTQGTQSPSTDGVPTVPQQRRRIRCLQPGKGSRPATRRGAGETRGPAGKPRARRRSGPRDVNGRD